MIIDIAIEKFRFLESFTKLHLKKFSLLIILLVIVIITTLKKKIEIYITYEIHKNVKKHEIKGLLVLIKLEVKTVVAMVRAQSKPIRCRSESNKMGVSSISMVIVVDFDTKSK